MNLVEAAKAKIQDQWSALAEITKQNQAKVLKHFRNAESVPTVLQIPPAMVIMIWAEMHWKMFIKLFLKPKQLWLDRRSFPEPMQLISAYPY